MKRVIAGVALAAGLLVAEQAAAETYRVAATTKGTIAYLNEGRIVVTGTQRSIWLTLVSSNPLSKLDREAAYRVERWDIDCRAGRYRTTFVAHYKESGDLVYSRKVTDDWSDAVPMSFGDEIIQTACNAATPDNPPREADMTTLLMAARATLKSLDR